MEIKKTSVLSNKEMEKLHTMIDLIEPLYSNTFINESFSKKKLKKKLITDVKFLKKVKINADKINNEIKHFEHTFGDKLKTIKYEIIRCNRILKYINEKETNEINNYEQSDIKLDLLVYSKPPYQDICKIYEKINLESIYKNFLINNDNDKKEKKKENKKIFTKLRFQLNKYYSEYNKLLMSYKKTKNNQFTKNVKELEEKYISEEMPTEYKKLCDSKFNNKFLINFHIKYWLNIGQFQYLSFDDYLEKLYNKYFNNN